MDLGWESLQSRRNTHKLLLFYIIPNGISLQTASLNLCLLLSKKPLHIVLETLIISETIEFAQFFFLSSFFLLTIPAWNDVKSATSVASFNHGIKRDIKESQKYYNVGAKDRSFMLDSG